jgi:predicted alpha/beta-hydrolase family hydrolase
MTVVARGLAGRGLRVARFEFPYMAGRRQGGGRGAPDPPRLLEATWLEAIAALGGGRDLVIGGKSMGGRMATHLAAQGLALTGVVVLGYPLHPPGRPDQLRVEHLARIRQPLLVVQGERDAFGTPDELRPFLAPLPAATIHVVEGGDHSFKVARRGPIRQEEVFEQVQDLIARWIAGLP